MTCLKPRRRGWTNWVKSSEASRLPGIRQDNEEGNRFEVAQEAEGDSEGQREQSSLRDQNPTNSVSSSRKLVNVRVLALADTFTIRPRSPSALSSFAIIVRKRLRPVLCPTIPTLTVHLTVLISRTVPVRTAFTVTSSCLKTRKSVASSSSTDGANSATHATRDM